MSAEMKRGGERAWKRRYTSLGSWKNSLQNRAPRKILVDAVVAYDIQIDKWITSFFQVIRISGSRRRRHRRFHILRPRWPWQKTITRSKQRLRPQPPCPVQLERSRSDVYRARRGNHRSRSKQDIYFRRKAQLGKWLQRREKSKEFKIEIYDPRRDRWEKFAQMPMSRPETETDYWGWLLSSWWRWSHWRCSSGGGWWTMLIDREVIEEVVGMCSRYPKNHRSIWPI